MQDFRKFVQSIIDSFLPKVKRVYLPKPKPGKVKTRWDKFVHTGTGVTKRKKK